MKKIHKTENYEKNSKLRFSPGTIKALLKLAALNPLFYLNLEPGTKYFFFDN